MSGVEDGLQLSLAVENGDGQFDGERWTINIGRREDNDICLRHDMFSSRLHARIHRSADGWLLEDCDSTNGTFIEVRGEDQRISGTISIQPGDLFRVGRTWMRIEPET